MILLNRLENLLHILKLIMLKIDTRASLSPNSLDFKIVIKDKRKNMCLLIEMSVPVDNSVAAKVLER